MALPWHIPLEAAPSYKKKTLPPEPTLLKHYCMLDIHENPCEELLTGIMCDISNSNRDPSTIQRLISSGMTIARLKLHDMEPEGCAQLIQSIRQAVYNYSAELEYVYPLAVIVDVIGPDIITGDLKGGPKASVELVENSTVRLTSNPIWRETGTAECLYVGYDHLGDLMPNDTIFIDSLTKNKVTLVVIEIGDDSIECKVTSPGTIRSKMAVRISRVPQDNPKSKAGGGDSQASLSCSSSSVDPFENMEQQIAWAVASDIDALLVPKVQHGSDILYVKDALSEKGKHMLVFASIDTSLALDNIDNILNEADGLYFDRCILSIDLPVEKIFIAVKIITSKCLVLGKPCVCKAIINEQIPTLCVTDISNLVLDGADVLFLELHYDSPLRKFAPSYDAIRMAEQCIAAAAVICRNAEKIRWLPEVYGDMELMQSRIEEPTKALCLSATELAVRSRAAVIICLTNSGRTAKLLSQARPPCPVVAITRACHTARQLRFWRGVSAVHYFEVARGNWSLEVDSRIRAGLDYCKAKRILRAGDPYVVVTGTTRGSGYCDSVRLLYASARDAVMVE